MNHAIDRPAIRGKFYGVFFCWLSKKFQTLKLFMSNSINEKKFLFWAKLTLGILGVFAFFAPMVLTLPQFLHPHLDFSNTGEIGDTIGGTTAPFIGLLGAILLFITIYQQHQAWEKTQSQRNEDKEEEDKVRREDKHELLILRLLDRHNQTFLEAVNNLNNISISTPAVTDEDKEKALAAFRGAPLNSGVSIPYPIFPTQIITGLDAILCGFHDLGLGAAQVKQFMFSINLVCIIIDELEDKKYDNYQDEIKILRLKINVFYDTLLNPLKGALDIYVKGLMPEDPKRVYVENGLEEKYNKIKSASSSSVSESLPNPPTT